VPRQPDGPPPAPVVQRLRVHYAKRDRLRFTSHRDFQRALERALRRAGVPVAVSAGFTPHPKISYAGAAPTGVASEAEYVEIGLQVRMPPAEVGTRLDAALPPGLDVVEVVEAAAPGSLADRLQASHWRITLGCPPEEVGRAVAAFLAEATVTVERITRDGRRPIDARGAVVSASVARGTGASTGGEPDSEHHCATIDLVVRHTIPAVRPDDVLAALRQAAGLVPPEPPYVIRLAQGLLREDGRIADPLAPDREAVTADTAPAPTPPDM